MLCKTKVLKPGKNTRGYPFVIICKNREMKNFKVHRLVAEAFIPNPLNKPEVNHKNEIKTDNRVENLEWMTGKENCNYGTRNERVAKAQSKPVKQFTKDGVFVQDFISAKEAERQTGIFHTNIVACLKGKYKSAGGYVWKYKFSR